MKKITIEIPDNTELVKTETGYELKVVDVEKKWEDFWIIKGYFVNRDSSISSYYNNIANVSNRNTYPTEKEAEIYGIIMPQLLQWRDKVNKDCKLDWSDSSQVKWCICQNQDYMTVNSFYTAYKPLHFKTQAIAEQFYKDHKTLIDKLIQ
jgi:hypothetical protein